MTTEQTAALQAILDAYMACNAAGGDLEYEDTGLPMDSLREVFLNAARLVVGDPALARKLWDLCVNNGESVAHNWLEIRHDLDDFDVVCFCHSDVNGR